MSSGKGEQRSESVGIAWLAVLIQQPFTRPGGIQSPLAAVLHVPFLASDLRLRGPEIQAAAGAGRSIPCRPLMALGYLRRQHSY